MRTIESDRSLAMRVASSIPLEARLAMRALVRRPVYATSFVLTLAIGTAVAATTYGVAHWIALRPLPGVRGGEHLKTLRVGAAGQAEFVSWNISEPDFETLRDRLSSLAQIAATTAVEVDLRVGDALPSRIAGELVSANYFDVLHTRLVAGRTFAQATIDADHAVIVSASLAAHLADNAPWGVGRTVSINGQRLNVIGVVERGFAGVERTNPSDIWLPVSALPMIDPGTLPGASNDRMLPVWRLLVARAEPGVTSATLAAAGKAVIAAIHKEFPGNSFLGSLKEFQAFDGVGLDPAVRKTVRTTLWLIGGAALLVLILATANITNLALANESVRTTMTEIQCALGASRSRLVANRAIEGAMLGLVAGSTAIAVAALCGKTLENTKLSQYGAALAGLTLDGQVVIVALAVAMVGAMVGASGALLMRSSTSADLSRRTSSPGRDLHRTRATLVAVQVALSLTLLVAAGLLGTTVANLRRINPGFDADHLLTFAIDPKLHGLIKAPLQSMLVSLESDIRRRGSPTGFIGPSPLRSSYFSTELHAGSDSAARSVRGAAYFVTPGFLETIGARVLAGTKSWRADSGTAVIDRAMADSLAPRIDPRELVGRSFPRRARGANPVTIAAVVENMQLSDITHAPAPTIFRPISEAPRDLTMRGFVRGGRAEDVRAAVSAGAADLPIYDIRTARAMIDLQFADRLSMAWAARTMAWFGVALAMSGLYGVLSTLVAARQREIAIRIALGATASHVRARVLRAGIVPVAVGVLAGTLGAAFAARLVKAHLYGISEFDPANYTRNVVMLLAVALAACLIPARRALRISPDEALRVD